MSDKNFTERLYDRIFANPIYFIFGLSWFLVHWRFFVVMFLVSNESVISSYGVTKDVYLKHILFDTNSWWVSSGVVLIPFVVTWVILYWVQPRFLVMLFKKHKDYEVEKEKVEIRAKKEILTEETQVVKKEEEKLVAQKKKATKQKEVEKTDPSFFWTQEYQEFKETRHYVIFDNVLESLYKQGGRTAWYPVNGAYEKTVPKSLLAYIHAHGLVELSNDKNNNQIITLTGKGKFFVGKYTEEKAV